MKISSEYHFPIFISSTDYNLVDLRAELARYLCALGYRPILSSTDGFPDSFPDLEPWESCLPVLESCFIMVLIIDGKYGTPFEWPHFKNIFNDRKLSPTHAEYIYAHKLKRKMLVFIRNDILSYYQSYRVALIKSNGNGEEAREHLKNTLPQSVKFETLQFIEEVKKTKPIPWIKTFDDVTSIKREIQKKMLNELAEVFRIKNKYLETVVHAFSILIEGLTKDKRNEVLQSIGATRELIEAIENQTATIQELRDQEKTIKAELDRAQADIEKGRKTSKDKKELESKVAQLIEEQKILKGQISKYERANTSVLIGSGNQFLFESSSIGSRFVAGGYNSPGGLFGDNINSIGVPLNPQVSIMGQKCDKCGKIKSTSGILEFSSYRKCPKCNRNFCSLCWPLTLTLGGTDMSESCEYCK